MPLHNGQYDFNDGVPTVSSRFFARIILQQLPFEGA